MEVEVHTGAIVKEVGDRGVTVNGEFVPSRTVVWAAGNAAAPIGKSLGANVDRAGRVIVNEDLSIPGHPESFAIGDMTCFKHQNGSAVTWSESGSDADGPACQLEHSSPYPG